LFADKLGTLRRKCALAVVLYSQPEHRSTLTEHRSICQHELMRADARKNYDHILDVARRVIAADGADASLRDIARRADVGLGTLYRHFPTREALLEALLRTSLDDLTQQASKLETSRPSDEALLIWFREAVAFTHRYNGAVALMATALEDPDSALHASCTQVRSAGARLLLRAQADGLARDDIDGGDMLSLIAALAWLSDQPAFAPRADHLSDVIVDAILTNRSSINNRPG
jgi:AcrR family transcriptional regulator